ncbi:PIG-L deacetylase family protein [Actinocrispum wychmicini]|uniref:LmbE family N-acetylglucosaminyl deacetylase n=1 Tax=Actinocrispum wychmicini TaxID=1213861 RepID=A0A4R2JYW4_9PSEU|nr:PIG-L deacetylase family protein [Actinocrispum wychmicini]TCO65124.1 LmbE family N-acetylglucosaminyl deacetylase [Actinocrispum wychmicini]
MRALRPDELSRVALLGAHCDDVAIGVGGTLLALCRSRPGLRVDALVLSGGGTLREAEEHAALQAFCPGASLKVTVLDLPDGRFPAHWERAKQAVESFRTELCHPAVEPDIVFAPHVRDAHQDHRMLAELVPTAFRDHLVLRYEIVKWDGDLGAPTVYQPLPDRVAEAKVDALLRHYPSQRDRDWFDAETFLGLARVRGVECRARYAEAFHVDKMTIGLEA